MATKKKSEIVGINDWKEKTQDMYCASDGKIFYMLFEKLFSTTYNQVKVYDKFFIKKGSYEKQLEIITKYINYFVRFYDPEKEIFLSFLKIKFAMDKEKKFNEDNADQLIGLIYEVLFTDSIIEKINRMVDDNYTDDIESSANSKKYINKKKKHLESLEFTNMHIKILLRISFGMKCISPILFHYVAINVIKLNKDSDLIYRFYRKLFDIFSPPEINMYNKLFVYVKAKVLESKSHNAPIFDQRDIMGNDEYTVIHHFVQKVLISENIVKYKFNENIIGFNKTIIKYQLNYFLKEQYSKNLTEVTSAKNADGLSGMDKMEMNLIKIDEGIILLTDFGNKLAMNRIIEDNDFDITEDEIQYYIKNHHPEPEIMQFVYDYWSSDFGCLRNTAQLTRHDYIILLLILKKKLLMQAGSDPDNFDIDCKLPYILTGNVQDKINTRLIRNNKYNGKVDVNYLYDKIVKKKYKNLCQIRPEHIKKCLSKVISTVFTYVVYEDQDKLGQVIDCDEDKISDELLFLINQI